MSNPQASGSRRSGRGAGTPQDSASMKAAQQADKRGGGKPHGSDKGERGGGEGGGTPPDQREEHG